MLLPLLLHKDGSEVIILDYRQRSLWLREFDTFPLVYGSELDGRKVLQLGGTSQRLVLLVKTRSPEQFRHEIFDLLGSIPPWFCSNPVDLEESEARFFWRNFVLL